MHPGVRHVLWLLCLTFSAASIGCQAAGKIKAPVENIEPDREHRKQETVRDFEARRDDAQYKAAVASWQQGDTNGCLDSLMALLKRNPKHAGGLQLLDELEQVADVADEHGPGLIPGGDTRSPAGVIKPPADLPIDQWQRNTDAIPDSGVVQAADHWSTDEGAPGSSIGSSALRANAPAAYRTGSGNYDGGAHGEVARRSVRQAVEALSGGNTKLAATYYRAAVAAESDNGRIPIAAAVMSLRYEQSELALEMAQLATSNYADNAAAHRTLGVVHYRRGEYKASRISLERAISLDKSHPLSYFLMGSTLARLGETEAANWNFQQAHRLDPKYCDPR